MSHDIDPHIDPPSPAGDHSQRLTRPPLGPCPRRPAVPGERSRQKRCLCGEGGRASGNHGATSAVARGDDALGESLKRGL